MRVLPLFILPLFAVAAFAEKECPPRYSYCGYSGPGQWQYILFKEKNECNGRTQSPINLGTPAPTRGEAISVEYVGCYATIRNTGHDIEVTPTCDDNKVNKITIKIGNNVNVYKLLQLHFHVPNEHLVPRIDEAVAEMHILHELNGGTDYAVIGVMLMLGNRSGALEPVFANLPKNACDKVDKVPINFRALLPEKLTSYYTYAGSLTTPPCTEKEKTVTWYVLDGPRPILEAHKDMLAGLGANARPIQTNRLPVTYVSPP